MSGISKSQVSRLCEEIDGKVKAFLYRPVEGDWPYLWIDATYLKVRQARRILGTSPRTSVAAIVAVGVNAFDRREVLGLDIGAGGRDLLDRLLAQAQPSCASSAFLRKLSLLAQAQPPRLARR